MKEICAAHVNRLLYVRMERDKDKIIGLFCKILSLLQGSFAKETCAAHVSRLLYVCMERDKD